MSSQDGIVNELNAKLLLVQYRSNGNLITLQYVKLFAVGPEMNV